MHLVFNNVKYSAGISLKGLKKHLPGKAPDSSNKSPHNSHTRASTLTKRWVLFTSVIWRVAYLFIGWSDLANAVLSRTLGRYTEVCYAHRYCEMPHKNPDLL